MQRKENTTDLAKVALLLFVIFLLSLSIESKACEVVNKFIFDEPSFKFAQRCEKKLKESSLRQVLKCSIIAQRGCGEMTIRCRIKGYVEHRYDPDMEVDKYVER